MAIQPGTRIPASPHDAAGQERLPAGIRADDLAAWLATELQISRFKDYCPNGLQVEGRSNIRHIIAGVTASEAIIRHAIEQNADTLLVHHGWFWKNEDPRVRGIRRTRLALMLAHDINLFAYHLPLDAHLHWGNNAQLARVLGLEPTLNEEARHAEGGDSLIWYGTAPGLATLGELAQRVEQRLARTPLLVGDPSAPVGQVAWCTGAAQGMLQEAIDGGADVYITGEVSEPTVHRARETGTGFIGAGHHATERYGVQALGREIAARFDVRVDFVDIDNPV
jgi:dinuclear metal center YbgI/SA1388 family protein